MSFLKNVALGGLGNFSGAFTNPIIAQAEQGNLGILPKYLAGKSGGSEKDPEKARIEKMVKALMQGGGGM